VSKPEFAGQERIGLVTVTYNSELVLDEFLNSLMQQSYPQWRLYVVDNASHDRTLEVLAARPGLDAVVISNKDNVGVADGNNQGIQAAIDDGCDYVLLINNDTVFGAGLIDRLHAGLHDAKVDMTTCKMYYHDRPDLLWYAGGDFRKWLGYAPCHFGINEVDQGQYNVARAVAYTPTCCLLMRVAVFSRVGMMDAKYFAYYDDADYLFRCMRRGLVLHYLPEIKLWHKVSSLTASLPDFSMRLLARNRIYFIRKHLSWGMGWVWYLAEKLRFVVQLAMGKSSSAALKIQLRAAKDGWRMAHRKPPFS
jgi:GT2 family glycosyltransferase